MLVIGAKGHAKEILGILNNEAISSDLHFFDNISENLPDKLFDKFPIINNDEDVINFIKIDPNFILGIGGTKIRFNLYCKIISYGGLAISAIADSAIIGNYNVIIGDSVSIMHKVFVSNDVIIGKGTLLNSGCSIHHDSHVGEFCEICPGAIITGGVYIGNYTSIGAGAIILPKLMIGNNVTIGAGAVVTHNIAENAVVAGIPARAINKNHF